MFLVASVIKKGGRVAARASRPAVPSPHPVGRGNNVVVSTTTPSPLLLAGEGKTGSVAQEETMIREFIQFMRFTLQGIAIASIGTLGVTPSWGGFCLGMFAFFAALAFLSLEKGE